MQQDLYIHSISAGNFILQKFVKLSECHFWANSLVSGLLGPLLLKSCRVWGWFIPKKNSYLNDLPVKQIEEKAQCAFMSLFLTTSNGSHDRNEKSYIARENWKVLSYMRNTKRLIRNMEDHNVCPMSYMSVYYLSRDNLFSDNVFIFEHFISINLSINPWLYQIKV